MLGTFILTYLKKALMLLYVLALNSDFNLQRDAAPAFTRSMLKYLKSAKWTEFIYVPKK